MPDITEQNFNKTVLQRLNALESHLFARKGRNDSRWVAIGTVSVWFLLAIVALAGVFLTQPGVFHVLQSWLTRVPYAGGASGSLGSGATENSANNPEAFTQFMTLFLAISAGGIAYLASAMGMKRLERYDEQFQAFREERQSFLDRFETKFNVNAQDLKDNIKNIFDSKEEDLI